MSHSTRLYFLFLLLANASYLASTEKDHDVVRYCRLCNLHTMCLYPFDDIGAACDKIDRADLDPEDIDEIVHQHNEYRNIIASGEETRGKPGPQPSAKNMMELTWDVELAKVARRWVIQCISGKDKCRDVDRFGVWQNVNILDVDSVESGTSSQRRIPFHVQSWLDDVENFDNAEVGMVDYAKDEQGPYIGIATGDISRIGCGRAMYSVVSGGTPEEKMTRMRYKKNATSSNTKSVVNITTSRSSGSSKSSSSSSSEHLANTTHLQRLEILVCNYGPIDRTTPRILYEDGMPGQCPTGFHSSKHYEYLCRSKEEILSPRRGNSDNGRSCCNIVEYCIWTSLIFTQLCRSLINVLLSSGW